MSIINTLSLKSNRQIKINFDGGDLSSDAGLLLIKEFVSKLGIDRLFSHLFKTNDSTLLALIYYILLRSKHHLHKNHVYYCSCKYANK